MSYINLFMDRLIENFASKDRVFVIAPAGYGKTELIVKSVSTLNSGRQLLLTHTHAGVNSLRQRFKKYNIPSALYKIDTIAGFSLQCSVAYPITSGIVNTMPTRAEDWINIYESVSSLLSQAFFKKIITASYKGLFVDEYQDCNTLQHSIIMKLSDILPCRIVGDPLQGIFDFDSIPLVDWKTDMRSIDDE